MVKAAVYLIVKKYLLYAVIGTGVISQLAVCWVYLPGFFFKMTAIKQDRLKRMLTYSSFSRMELVFVAFGKPYQTDLLFQSDHIVPKAILIYLKNKKGI
ncbi:MAG TPA: hypothetical protein ENK25_03110 [Bacteroidetes bacterium]|nr:hypothetical protein [Bacteroidota bacterium]